MKNSILSVGIDSLLERLIPLRQEWTRYVYAISLALFALLVALFGQFILGSVSAVVFACAVIFSVAVFGMQAAFCTVVLAVISLDLFQVYVTPGSSSNLTNFSVRIALELTAVAGGAYLVRRRVSVKLRSRVKPPAGMHASLDGIYDGELSGWAFDADHPESPLLLNVFVNGLPVANVAAVYYRPDVAEVMECCGKYGFYVDLAERFTVDTEAVVDVHLPNGKSASNSPRALTVHASRRPETPTVLFMHIAKTAGTAFREAIAANFRQSELAYLYPTAPGFLVNDLRALPLEQRRALRMIIGHFQFGMHVALPQESQYITIVREPSARVLSHYAYLQQAQPELVTEHDRVLALEEVLESRLSVDFDNALVRYFSGVDERDFPPGSLTRDIFAEAVRNLNSSFAFVGHQESSIEAYATLQKRYGWHAAGPLQIVNPGTVRLPKTISPGLHLAVRHFNRWDFLFYEEILRAFPRGQSLTSGHQLLTRENDERVQVLSAAIGD